jgi:hypothetical protein
MQTYASLECTDVLQVWLQLTLEGYPFANWALGKWSILQNGCTETIDIAKKQCNIFQWSECNTPTTLLDVSRRLLICTP